MVRILLVEDDFEMRSYIEQLLSASFHVLAVANGQEALELLSTQQFDLIISDISMPQKNGIDLLNVLRNQHNDLTPFIILTAMPEKEFILKALLFGVDSYITKPFDTDELLARVHNLLENNRRRRLFYQQSLVAEDEIEADINQPFKQIWLKELEVMVLEHIASSHLKVPDIAHKMAVSERTLRSRVRAYTGMSPNQYFMEIRLQKALDYLERGVFLTVAEVAYKVGLNSSGYFTKVFSERFGKKPTDYLKS